MAFYPASETVQQLALTANVVLVYPYSVTVGVTITDRIDVTPTQAGCKITLPDATQTQNGFRIIFNNVSGFSFDLMLNNGTTKLITVNAGIVLTVYLIDNTTINGTWRTVSSGAGASALTELTVNSSDQSVIVQNGVVSPPSGTVTLTLPQILSSLMALSNQVSPGYLVLKSANPLTWAIRTIEDSTNITLVNSDGSAGNTVINLDDTITVTQVTAGNIVVSGNSITNTSANSTFSINSTGSSSSLNFNGLTIGANGNMISAGNLTLGGSFIAPNTVKAWCRFANTSGTVNVLSAFNVSNVVFTGVNSQYTLTFTTPMGNTNYAVGVFPSNSGTPPLNIKLGWDVSRNANSVSIVLTDASGQYLSDAPNGVSVLVMSLT
jgi:hypothetical protein